MADDSSPCQVNAGFRVRAASADDMATFRAWADAEGWNPGRHDGACFFEADHHGFFVGELVGEPIACISCVRYGEGFGFLGQYIVQPEHRGKGFGLRVWSAGMAHLGSRNIGLDGAISQMPNYEKSGFRHAHNHIRYSGVVHGRISGGITRLDAIPLADILDYDRACFPGPREAFLRAWVAQPDLVALGVVREGKLAGFGCVRRASEGFKIGPLFADDDLAAESLFLGLAKEVGGPLVIDVPDPSFHPTAVQLVLGHGMTEVFQRARMYTRGRPHVNTLRVYAITSLELG